MSSKTKLNLCIQVHPNEMDIDYGRIALTDDVRQRLVHLCKIVGGYQLDSAACQMTQVQWYKAGQVVAGENYTTCTLWGSERDKDLAMSVEATFLGDRDEHGVYSSSYTIQGLWIFCTIAELDQKSLQDSADNHGDIEITCDLGSPLEAATRTAEYRRALYLARRNHASALNSQHERMPWPDPFDRWQDRWRSVSSARSRLPRNFQPEIRSAVANVVLEKLFQAFLIANLHPNQRCALYTLAAALIICPNEVTLTRNDDNIPLFLRKIDSETIPDEQHLRIEDVAPPKSALCGTCDQEFQFEKVIRLGYKRIFGQISLDALHNVKAAHWTTRRRIDDLALLYEDHANNDFALAVMRELAHKYTDDLSRLKLLAFGLDALKRLLDNDYPWFDEVRSTMEDPDCWYDKLDSNFAKKTKP